jgi:pyruvate kinase
VYPTTGETANGDFPEDAVRTMAAICNNAEEMVDVEKRYDFLRNHTPKPMTGAEAVASSAVQTAIDIGAKAIVCITSSGRGPQMVSKYRPPMPVFVVTSDKQLIRHCRTVFGQVGIDVKDENSVNMAAVIDRVAQEAKTLVRSYKHPHSMHLGACWRVLWPISLSMYDRHEYTCKIVKSNPLT